jgi:hypothetical protein
MMGTKEPENYRVSRHMEVKRTNSWMAPVGLMIFVGITFANFGHYFLAS